MELHQQSSIRMFLRIAGGFCLGLGLSLMLGLTLLIPGIKPALDTNSDPAGWYGSLEGVVRGSLVYLSGTAATLIVGVVAGVAFAASARRPTARWSYLGYPVLAAPILFLFLFIQGARKVSQSEANHAAAQSEAISRDSVESMAASSERSKAESRAQATAKYGDPIGGSAEMDRLGLVMGNLYFPGASLGTNYATRTDPPSIDWPVVSLKCPTNTTLETVRAYYEGIGITGADSAKGTGVVRPGDREAGRLYVRQAQALDPDQRTTVIFIADGF